MQQPEEVILVDESDQSLGTMEKMEAHRRGLLHRAFSVFIFNSRGEMLLQQRAPDKYHSAGLWSNACCSHPRPGEETADAASRRLREELGFTTPLEKLFHFTYKSEFENGLTEYEFDHVFVGVYDEPIYANTAEVSDCRYESFDNIRECLRLEPGSYTSWFHVAFPMLSKKMAL
jgi:isopentenyl-diphosphate Delta-isomerase